MRTVRIQPSTPRQPLVTAAATRIKPLPSRRADARDGRGKRGGSSLTLRLSSCPNQKPHPPGLVHEPEAIPPRRPAAGGKVPIFRTEDPPRGAGQPEEQPLPGLCADQKPSSDWSTPPPSPPAGGRPAASAAAWAPHRRRPPGQLGWTRGTGAPATSPNPPPFRQPRSQLRPNRPGAARRVPTRRKSGP